MHESGDLELAYVDSEKAWLFRWSPVKMQEQKDNDLKCLNTKFLIKSSVTDTYDVVTVADQVCLGSFVLWQPKKFC